MGIEKNNEDLEESLEKADLSMQFIKLRNQQIIESMKMTKKLIDELSGHSYSRSVEFLAIYDDLKKRINETKL